MHTVTLGFLRVSTVSRVMWTPAEMQISRQYLRPSDQHREGVQVQESAFDKYPSGAHRNVRTDYPRAQASLYARYQEPFFSCSPTRLSPLGSSEFHTSGCSHGSLQGTQSQTKLQIENILSDESCRVWNKWVINQVLALHFHLCGNRGR